jgi:hypothetical protein
VIDDERTKTANLYLIILGCALLAIGCALRASGTHGFRTNVGAVGLAFTAAGAVLILIGFVRAAQKRRPPSPTDLQARRDEPSAA